VRARPKCRSALIILDDAAGESRGRIVSARMTSRHSRNRFYSIPALCRCKSRNLDVLDEFNGIGHLGFILRKRSPGVFFTSQLKVAINTYIVYH